MGNLIIAAVGYGYAALLICSTSLGLWWARTEWSLGDRDAARSAFFASSCTLAISAACFFLTRGYFGCAS